MKFSIIKDGIVQGMSSMFDAVLHESIVLEMEDGWRELFIPFENAIEVKEGDEVVIDIHYSPGNIDSLEITYQ